MMTRIEQLRELASKAGSEFSADDKFFIKTLSSEMGLDFKPRYNCKDCYVDQAALLYKMMKEAEPGESAAAFVLKEGVDVIYRGRRICAETLTDDFAREMIALGFPTEYFSKC